MPEPAGERRRKKRFGVKGCTIRYRRTGLAGFFEEYSPRYLVLNISEGGAHFIAKDELKEGHALNCQIDAPGLQEPLETQARVIWVRKSTEFSAFRVGVEFTAVRKADQPRLKSLLDNAVLDKIDMATKMYLKEIQKL
jgi:c-di-GMP-binding flagellar brake protein YcgR